jgi:hypothetical protein
MDVSSRHLNIVDSKEYVERWVHSPTLTAELG